MIPAVTLKTGCSNSHSNSCWRGGLCEKEDEDERVVHLRGFASRLLPSPLRLVQMRTQTLVPCFLHASMVPSSKHPRAPAAL